MEAEAVEPKVAIVRCGGDCEHTSPKEDYRGIASCQAAKLFFGGKGTCTYGCLGFGDCAKVCPHDAIYWNNGIAAIDQSVCVGCGLCAKTCPQQVIAIIPQSAKTAVLCSNHDKGALTRKACSAGCIGCMKCVKTCEHDAVHVEGNLASVDYEKWCRLRRVRTGLPDRRAARSYRECRSEGLLNFLMAVQPPSLQCGDGGSSFPTEILRVFSRCKIRENGV